MASAWDPRKTYELTAQEQKAVAERAQMRATRKAEFLKLASSPYQGETGYVFDPALQRYLAMKASTQEFFKPNWRSGVVGLAAYIVPCAVISYLVYKSQTAREVKYRNGEVKYKDRDPKWLY